MLRLLDSVFIGHSMQSAVRIFAFHPCDEAASSLRFSITQEILLRCQALHGKNVVMRTVFHSCAGCVDGKVDWGHLAAGDAALNAAFTRDGQQYDMIGNEVEHMDLPGQQVPGNDIIAPMGRGRDMVQPAWMTNAGAATAPGSEGVFLVLFEQQPVIEQ